MRALLMENDALTARSIELALSEDGILCDSFSCGEDIMVSQCQFYDICICDLGLGSNNFDGCDLILQLRAANIRIPILIVSGMSSVENKVRGLGFGADDFLAKPFNRSELVARVQAIVRRSKGHPSSIIKIGKLSINIDNRTVEVAGKPIHLTSKEYAICELLALRPNTVLTKEMFLNHLYAGIDEPELKIIDVFVCKLRKKIAQECDGESYIETMWGRGYMMKDTKPPEDVISNKQIEESAN